MDNVINFDRLAPVTTFAKMELARIGVTKSFLEKLKAQARVDYETLARLLAVTRATLINKKKQEKFSPSLSERIVSLAELFDHGAEVFGEHEAFNRWLSAPNAALGGTPPYAVIDNQFGREEVNQLLGRIAYGVFS